MSLGGRPLRFVGLVLATWIGARVAVLPPGAPEVLRHAPAPVRRVSGVAIASFVPTPGARMAQGTPRRTPASVAAVSMAHRPVATPASTGRPGRAAFTPAEATILASPPVPRRRQPPGRPRDAGPDTATVDGGGPSSRWSGDAYLFLRGGATRALGPGGQIGGGQAFARLSYRLDEAGRVAAVARLSRAVGARQAEAALGLAVAPPGAGPVRLTVERRVAIDAGGRNAWAAFVAAGIDDRAIGPLRFDGYAQSGIVGARRTDAFIDGAARLGRGIGRLTLGAGLWGAAQPGAARLDLGPQAALRLATGHAGATLALDWRIRVAGRARPRNGGALTLAAGF